MSLFPDRLGEFFLALGPTLEDGIDLFRYGLWENLDGLIIPRVGDQNYPPPVDTTDFSLGQPLSAQRIYDVMESKDAHHDDPSLAAILSPLHKVVDDGLKTHWKKGTTYKRLYLQGEVCSMLTIALTLARNSFCTQTEFFNFFQREDQEGGALELVLISLKMHNVALKNLINPDAVILPWEKREVDALTKQPGEVSIRKPGELPYIIEYIDKCGQVSDPATMIKLASPGKRDDKTLTPSERAEQKKLARNRARLKKLKDEFQNFQMFGPSTYPILMLELIEFGEVANKDRDYQDYLGNWESLAYDTPF